MAILIGGAHLGIIKKRTEGYIRPPGPDQQVTIFHRIQYAAVMVLNGYIRLMPYAASRWLGRRIGMMFYTIAGRHRRIAGKNLDQVFGDTKTDAEIKRIIKTCFAHFGMAIMETLYMSNVDGDHIMDYAEFEGVEHFDKALAEGKGLILCSAHYGNWEIMNLALGFRGIPMSVMARPIDNPLVHDYLERIRTKPGNRVIYKHKSIRKMLGALSENRCMGIVNDQDVGDRSRIMIPFFGRDAATTPAPAALAHKTGAPIITGYAEPVGKGRYKLKFGELIYADQEATKDEEITRITKLLATRLESQIQTCPHPWMWMHQRFKTGLEGRTEFYKKPVRELN